MRRLWVPTGASDPRERTRSVLRGLFLATIILAVIPYGSVETTPFLIVTIALGVIGVAAAALTGVPATVAPLFRLVLGVAVVAVALIVAQSVAFDGNPLAHPVWSQAQNLLGPLPGAVSVDPASTRFSALWIATPAIVFLTTLLLFDDDARALRLMTFLAWSGGLVGLFSILQFKYSPHVLLVDEKEYYLDSLTAVFVNRNTAATYLGVTAILILAIGLDAARNTNWRQAWLWLAGTDVRAKPPIPASVLVSGALFVVTVTALFLTKSRGGVGATLIAVFILIAIVARPFDGALGREAQRRRLRYLGVATLALLATPLLLAERVTSRIDQQGLDDQRFCMWPSIWSGVRDRFWTGSGFGAFKETFPLYRGVECGVYGVWDRAHNGYLEFMMGLGAPALVLILILILGLARVYLQGLRERRRLRHVPAAALAALALVSLHAAVDFSLQIPGVAALVSCVLAAAATVSVRRGGRPKPADGLAAAA